VRREKVNDLKIFVPIKKVDEAQRIVYGVLAEEAPDKAGEIFDYESSKPLFQAWSSDFEKRTTDAGVEPSRGNLRSMHDKIVAGKFVDVRFDDAAKNIPVAAKVVDDNEWQKVLAGCYTGFSIGGNYEKRWKDESTGLMRYTAKPGEGSLVDNPCMYGATFSIVRSAGSTDLVKFTGLDEKTMLQKGIAYLTRLISGEHDPAAEKAAPAPVEKTIKEEGGKFVLYDAAGEKKLGTYDTKQEAQDALAAIEAKKKDEAPAGDKTAAATGDLGKYNENHDASNGQFTSGGGGGGNMGGDLASWRGSTPDSRRNNYVEASGGSKKTRDAVIAAHGAYAQASRKAGGGKKLAPPPAKYERALNAAIEAHRKAGGKYGPKPEYSKKSAPEAELLKLLEAFPAPSMPVEKDAASVAMLAQTILDGLKELLSDAALLDGDPETWSLSRIIEALNGMTQVRTDAEGREDYTEAPEQPAEPPEDPAAAAQPPMAAAAPEGDLAKSESLFKAFMESTLSKAVESLKTELTKHIDTAIQAAKDGIPEAAQSAAADAVKSAVEPVTKSVEGLEARLKTVEETPAAGGRPTRRAEKTLGIGETPEGAVAMVNDIAKFLDTAQASGKVSPNAMREMRLYAAAAVRPA